MKSQWPLERNNSQSEANLNPPNKRPANGAQIQKMFIAANAKTTFNGFYWPHSH